jgi:hypothetical protein
MAAKKDQVLFLDFDGVLHPDAVYLTRNGPTLRAEGKLFIWAPALIEVLNEFPTVSIVLSTSWVRHLGFKRAVSFLPPELAVRVAGATWHSSMAKEWLGDNRWDGRTRYDQISRYAARAKLANWVSLDDDPVGWASTAHNRLVACDPSLGLSDTHTRLALINSLKGMSTD